MNTNRLSRSISVIALLCSIGSARAATPQVSANSPTRQEIRAPRATAVEIRFDQPMDPASVDARSFRVFGRWSGPASLAFEWQDSNQRLLAHAARPFSAGETVTVFVARTLRSSTGEPLARGESWQFWIAASPAPFAFKRAGAVSTRSPGEGLVRSYGGYGGDLNSDGFSDLAVTNENSDDLRIFYNDGAGNYTTFELVPLLQDGGPSANEGADFNHDGQIDLVIGNAFADATMVLLGDGQGGFEAFVPYSTAMGVRAVGVLDLDGDACEDIVSACRTGDRLAILRGDGTGAFTLVELRNTAGIGESALAVGDADGDGILDLFLGSDPGGNIQLFLGDGEGDILLSDTAEAGGRPWVLASGDLDGDGFCDVAAAGGYASTVSIILSNGDGTLGDTDIFPAGNLTVSIDLGDLDGDGDLDIVASNLFESSWTLYMNDGNGGFGNRLDLAATAAGSCAILHDRDDDGVLDLTAVDELADELVFFEHEGDSPPAPAGLAPRILWNEPNPLSDPGNQSMAIYFHVERAGSHRMELFDVRGRLVDEIFERHWGQGDWTVSWDGRGPEGRPLRSAVYWLRLAGPGGSDARSIVLLR
jgi:hypothetical protein